VPRRLASALVLAMMPAAAFAQDAPPGASSCSGCHAPNAAPGSPVPALNGRPATETVKAMLDFRSEARPATVMGRIARGFSDPEIDAIAQWLAKQKR